MKTVLLLTNYQKQLLSNLKRGLRSSLKAYFDAEEGAGVIELVLILVVLIGLVLVFKDKIGVLLNNIFGNINSSADAIYNH